MIKLRDYQNTAVAEIREALVRYRKVLFCAPCGMGKTICFSYIAQQSQRFNRKVLILSSRCEILMQNGGALESFNLDIDYIFTEAQERADTQCCGGDGADVETPCGEAGMA